jgi:hypothetical protein
MKLKMRRTLVFLSTLAASAGVLSAILPSSQARADEAQAEAQLIGMSGGGSIGDLAKNVEINTNNVYDYTFSAAPTDWKVQSGVWEMTNRWSCSPQWSWLGGRSEEVAAIWNKRRFSGDQSIQFYFAFKMNLAGTPRWTYHPADVALSFCGDGKNLGSGYTVIVGANSNTRSVLMKGGKVVTENKEKPALLPAMSDGMAPTNELHRHWWYVRVNKIGDRVECYLDNQLILTYTDPKPLDLGQIALWTYNNGIMLSRVQIYYENEVRGGAKLEVKTPAPAKTSTPTTLAQR